ncbi:MAG: hypothetical protein P2976_06140, partial [Gemmatimonadota bacterium]|nr:hypothetical protein [Gemmatimonadota bacterium]
VMEMTKRGVPGVWTYGFYDGWTPNYLFFAAHTRNATGRFYEVQSYGPDNNPLLRVPPQTTSREWFRPNPPLPEIKWGPRNSVNIGQSGVLFSLDHFAKNRRLYLENYWLKNKRALAKGTGGPIHGWVIPAAQRRRVDAVDAVNELIRQGLEIHVADATSTVGGITIAKGDFVIRGDQPYRTLAEMYFSTQRFPSTNPRPYDDTGWTFQLMRNVVLHPISDSTLFTQRMTRLTGTTKATGGITGSGPVILVDHTTDNALMTMRFKLAQVAMRAAQADFEVAGRKFRAGTFIIPNADASVVGPVLRELGLQGVAVATVPAVKHHDLDLPRIGYVHSWQRTQDEGWVRAALDTYGVPYTYFADQKLRDGNLRATYDVIIYPHVGGTAESQVNGIAKTGTLPLPYKKSDATPNLGANDASDDIRGGMGYEGLLELKKFVEAGGTLIVEGATATIFPEYKLLSGITVETPANLFVRGSVMRGMVTDRTSPITYGYGAHLPVYFNQAPVLSVGGGGMGAMMGMGGGGAAGQNVTPMATAVTLSAWDWATVDGDGRAAPTASAGTNQGARTSGGASGATSAAGGQGGGPGVTAGTRVVMRFPSNPAEMLLSGSLDGGQALANRAQVVDSKLGEGHVVSFGIRPFWRWQTHGTFFLGFNTILNWNDLDAGR